MRIIAGGFGAQGLSACAAISHISMSDVEFILTGLPAFHAASSKCLGRKEALRRTWVLLERCADYFEIIGSTGKKPSILDRVKYCYRWSREICIHHWREVQDLLPPSTEVEGIACEVMDIENMEIRMLTGDARLIAMGGLAFPGLFPPVEGKYINTTYFSQIPLSNLKDGSMVLWNIIGSRLKKPSIDVLLFSAILWRSEELVNQKLRDFEVHKVRLPAVIPSDVRNPYRLLRETEMILKNDGGL